jgi:hypothetical protein
MSKVFTSKQFIDKLKWLTTIPNIYHSGTGWSTLKNGKWQFDCVVSVKCILWGFTGDKNKFRGGTIYKSNGVPDFPCNAVNEICTEVSQNFANLTPGEYLCMKGTKYNHTGIYLGNNKVFEDTTGWGANKAIISEIDNKGNRSYNGKKLLRWTYHGKLKYIDYTDKPEPTPPTTKKYYQTYDNNKNKWLPKVAIGSSDYAGNLGNGVSGLRVDELEYRVHDKVKGYWLPWVKGNKDYAGNLPNNIDGVQIKNSTYRVHILGGKWLSWVNKVDNTNNGYAGIIGKSIDAIQIK